MEWKSWLLALAVAIPAQAQGVWVDLFDGKSLADWHVAARPNDRDRGFWRVEDGTITCDSRGSKNHDYVWLVYDKEFGNFELRLKVRGFRASSGNSGVQVRSRYDLKSFRMEGIQLDVHPPIPWRTGLVYDETREVQRWLSPSLPGWEIDESYAPKGWKWNYEGWNELVVVCRGTEITTFLNGVPTAAFNGRGILDDELHRRKNVGLRGFIALQLHMHDELRIQYKDIRLRTLE